MGCSPLTQGLTDLYESARTKVAIHAASTKKVLLRGTTTSLNWVAQKFAQIDFQKGTKFGLARLSIIQMVPWQQVAKQTEWSRYFH